MTTEAYEPRVYHDEDFPHGLRCARCDKLFVEGMRFVEDPDSFIGDTPVVVLICEVCEMGMVCWREAEIGRKARETEQ